MHNNNLHQTQQFKQSTFITNQKSALQQKNIIILKNQSLQPQCLQITQKDIVTIKVGYNNDFGFSAIQTTKKKFIFAIEQLDEQSIPLEQGQQFQFHPNIFTNKLGQFRLVCINLPKIQSRIIIYKSSSQSQQLANDQLFDNMIQNLNQQQKEQCIINSTNKLEQVKQQQPEEEVMKQQKESESIIGVPNSKSDLQEYERILTQQDSPLLQTLENKYLKYFKEEFKLWRDFFEQKQQKQKKQSLKSKHTRNLSLSEVKQIEPKHKSQYDSENESQNNSSSMGKNVSITSHLYSHQQILDRNNDEDITSGRRQMKKTNSQYGFNAMRSQQQKQGTLGLDKASEFGKEEQQIDLPDQITRIQHSRRSNNQKSSLKVQGIEKNKSYISSTRTQTNSPGLGQQYKKQNNFLTWAIEWSKEKQYLPVAPQKKHNDHHLIKQMQAFIKNSKIFDYFIQGLKSQNSSMLEQLWRSSSIFPP